MKLKMISGENGAVGEEGMATEECADSTAREAIWRGKKGEAN
jgi:hypothetical protein